MLPNSTSSNRDPIPLKATICTKARSMTNVPLVVFPQHNISENRHRKAVKLFKTNIPATEQFALRINNYNIHFYNSMP